jgi:hypothetical protein
VLVCGEDPNDESRFVLVQDKNSFGPKPTTGTAYRIETAVVHHKADTFKTSRVVWLGEVEIDSRHLLARPEEPDADRDDAAEFLRTVLADGGLPPKEMESEAKTAGFSLDQLKRAKSRAGVQSVKPGFGGPWVWQLREQEESTETVEGSEGSVSQRVAPFAPLGDSRAPLESDPEGAHRALEDAEDAEDDVEDPSEDDPVDLEHPGQQYLDAAGFGPDDDHKRHRR